MDLLLSALRGKQASRLARSLNACRLPDSEAVQARGLHGLLFAHLVLDFLGAHDRNVKIVLDCVERVEDFPVDGGMVVVHHGSYLQTTTDRLVSFCLRQVEP